MPKIVCVVPSIRPERLAEFRKAWRPLFEKHGVLLVTVLDGEEPLVMFREAGGKAELIIRPWTESGTDKSLFCRRTDAVRNLGFVEAARFKPDVVLTMDDDVAPPGKVPVCELDGDDGKKAVIVSNDDHDPIQAHLDALARRVPISWMNTAHMGAEYLRGVPYGVRDEAPVMLSHGVWVGTPDFDGETQLRLEAGGGVPHSLPYYVGPVPRGVLFPLCGMSVMVRKEALPYLYFAPMGPDSGVPELHRFADIWMGIHLKMEFDRLEWACYTGASTVLHTRASDAKKNFEQEKLGRQWNEWWPGRPDDVLDTAHTAYLREYADKRRRFADLIRSIQGVTNESPRPDRPRPRPLPGQ